MKKTIFLVLILIIALIGCSNDSDINSPAPTQSFDVANLKVGGGGSPQLDCNDLLGPDGMEEYFDMARNACNEQDSNVQWSNYGSFTDDDGKTHICISHVMQWKQVIDDKIYSYTYGDVCQHNDHQDEPIEPITPQVVTRYEGEIEYALLNRETSLYWPPYCTTWPNGDFLINIMYYDKTGHLRQFGMSLFITDDYHFEEDPGDTGQP